MQLAPFRAVIFDCDGVLVDSETLGLRSLKQALGEVGIERTLSFLTRFSGRSHGETLAELETESGLPLLKMGVAERMDECYVELARKEGLSFCPGVPELLAWLSDRKIPFAVASSGPRSKVLFSLQSAGIARAFSHIVCGDDVALAKPAPDLYLAAAALVGVEPVLCLAIEDAPNGVRSARAAGMEVVAITTTFAPGALAEATLVIHSLSGLPKYFSGPPDHTNLESDRLMDDASI